MYKRLARSFKRAYEDTGEVFEKIPFVCSPNTKRRRSDTGIYQELQNIIYKLLKITIKKIDGLKKMALEVTACIKEEAEGEKLPKYIRDEGYWKQKDQKEWERDIEEISRYQNVNIATLIREREVGTQIPSHLLQGNTFKMNRRILQLRSL